MKILFILSRFPYPLEKGDKLRAYQHLLHLNSAGYEVHVAAISDQDVDANAYSKIKPLCKSITILPLTLTNIFFNVISSFFRNLPIQVGYFYSYKHQKAIDQFISESAPDLIYCQLIRTACYIKNHTDIPLVIDYQDAFSKGTLQRTATAPWWLKPLFSRELKLVKMFEEQCYDWFNGHIIISSQDREAMSVALNKHVSIVPNGVDTSFFFPEPAEKKSGCDFCRKYELSP